MNRLIKFLLIGLFFLTACVGHLNIEKSDAPQGYADSQLVGIWKITGYSSNKPYDWNGDGSTETNIYNTWTPCEKDNLYQFIADKSGIFKINCSSSSPGTWQIVNTAYLVLKPTNQVSETEKFISMTSVEFKTTEEVTVSTGQSFTLTKTWSRQ
jgi:hypothetical protein